MILRPRCPRLRAALLGGASALAMFASPVLGQMELAKLTASDGAGGDNFGTSVAIDGDTIIVGSPFDDAGPSNCGSAYVYRQVAGIWVQEAKLLAGDRASNDQFGIGVGISGDVAVVGSVSSLLTLIDFLAVGAAMIVLRRRDVADATEGADVFRVPLSIAGVPIVPVLLAVSIVLLASRFEWRVYAVAAGVLVLGTSIGLARWWWSSRTAAPRAMECHP